MTTKQSLAESFIANYVTMNNQPPHRVDVLKAAFLAGYSAHEERTRGLAEALNKILPYVSTSFDLHATLAVNIPPAQQMRNAADALEKKDADVMFARTVLKSYEEGL